MPVKGIAKPTDSIESCLDCLGYGTWRNSGGGVNSETVAADIGGVA